MVWTLSLIARICVISLSDRRGREGVKPIWNALCLEKKLRTYEMLPNFHCMINVEYDGFLNW